MPLTAAEKMQRHRRKRSNMELHMRCIYLRMRDLKRDYETGQVAMLNELTLREIFDDVAAVEAIEQKRGKHGN